MPKISIECFNCGKPMSKWKSQIPKSGQSYCSLSCSTSYRNKNEFNPAHDRDITGDKNPMWGRGDLITGEKNGMSGRNRDKNPNWQGGTHMRKDGYFRVLTDEGRILMHRKILIDLGVDLEGKVVHHKNENPSDNRIENLEVMTQSEHAKLHMKLRNKNK
jgi:hypothetical protein